METLKIRKDRRNCFEIYDLDDLVRAWGESQQYYEVHAFKTAFARGKIQRFVEARAPKEVVRALSGTSDFKEYLGSLNLLTGAKDKLGDVLPIGPHFALMDSVFSSYAQSKDFAANFMLFGPPGCGKTLSAKYLAYKNGLEFRQISPSIFSDNPEVMRFMFRDLRRTQGAVLFVDEIDELARDRDASNGMNWGLNALLSYLDGSNWDSFIFVGATNLPWMLDPSLLRSGRIDYLLYAPTPTQDERLMLFRQFAPKTIRDGVLAEFSEKTRFYSTADIKGVCKKAVHRARMLGKEVDATDFFEVLGENPSTALDWYDRALASPIPKHARARVKPLFDELEEYKRFKDANADPKGYA